MPWVNTFISNLKTAIRGTCHHLDFAKYRRRCLAQAQYRINRRFHLVGRSIGMVTYHASSKSNFFQRNTTGAVFIS